MRRVLVIGMTSILGGVETYIYNLIKASDRSKFEFDFLVIGQEKEAVYHKQINDLINDGKNHFYYSPNLKRNYLKAQKWLKNFYDTHMYDVIYMNTCTAARIAYCSYAIKRKGVKLVTHSHNGNASSFLKGMNNRLYKKYTTRISSVRLACSEKAYEWLFSDSTSNALIIANGIDCERFKFSRENRLEIRDLLKIPDNKIVIGHIGRFSLQKNHKFFIEVGRKLPDKYMFLFVGDGEEKADFIQKLHENNIADKFTILKAQGDVEKYYSAMDIFAMPSLYEGLPIVAVEAQCNGLTCVLSQNVSEQTNISGRCIFLSIADVDLWIDELQKIDVERFDGEMIVASKGFSIHNTALQVEKILSNV